MANPMKAAVAIGFVIMNMALEAATIEYDPAGSGTWGEATRWKGGATFAAGDTVLVNGCTGIVYDADSAYFASAGNIAFSGTAPCIVVSNTVDFASGVTMDGSGTLLKLGSGEFNLTSYNKVDSYKLCYVDVVIKDGTLSLQGAKPIKGNLVLKNLSVYAPGRFMGTQYASMQFNGGLYGDGTVDNDTTGQNNRTMLFAGSSDFDNPAVFTGNFVGDAYYCSSSSGGGAQYLMGKNSTATRGMLLYSERNKKQVIGVSSFGNTEGVKAPWGTTQVQWRGWDNHLLYLGNGETSERTFYYGGGGKLPMLDAGEHGNLTLTGKWSINKKECNFMNGIDFAGGGTNYFKANFETTTNKNGRPIAVYVRKLGPGAWRFSDGPTRDVRGVFETVEGELQFDSIAERGEYSSLGDASVLHQRYCDQIDDSKAVPYAFLLGNGVNEASSPTLATMNYMGTTNVKVSTRPIAVSGAGRLKSDTAQLYWDGITAATAGEHSIVLGGDYPVSATGALTNGPGTLAVVKDGAGNWIIDGDCDATGGFKVKSGSLLIPDTANYEWYRLTVMGSFGEVTNEDGVVMNTLPSGEDGVRFTLSQWALLDENGVNQIESLPHNTAADGKPYLLQPGEAAMANTNYCYLGWDNGNAYKYVLTNLFNEDGIFAALNCTLSAESDGTIGTNVLVWAKSKGQAYVPDPDYHVRVVVRLPANANKITHYDLKSAGAWPNLGSQSTRIPRSWKLEGSANGITWHNLDTVISNSQDNIVRDGSGGAQRWFSNNSATLGTGYGPLPEGESNVRPSAVAVVSAAKGSLLESQVPIKADSLAYDGAALGGTIRGFTLADNATVDISGIGEGQLGAILPLDFEGAEAYSGKQLPVTINGVKHSAYSAFISQAGLRVVRKGFMVIFR